MGNVYDNSHEWEMIMIDISHAWKFFIISNNDRIVMDNMSCIT